MFSLTGLLSVLFTEFLKDLGDHLSKSGVFITETDILNCLLWADDLFLISSTPEGLQKLLRDRSEIIGGGGLKFCQLHNFFTGPQGVANFIFPFSLCFFTGPHSKSK